MTMLSSQSFALTPFQAAYQFSYNGKNLGTATRALQQTDASHWNYSFSAQAGIIASANENSQFSLSSGRVNSAQFNRNSKILVHNNRLSIQFTPSTKLIHAQEDDTVRTFAWETGALDELNAEIQAREDLQSTGLKNNYLIADAKGLDARKFIKVGTENINTPYGTFNTIKVRLDHGNSDKNTIFWLAPKLDYAPVKVMHNDGSNSYGLLITQYKAGNN
nr:DUF3108 domain-containing protein [Acinetobacter sp. MD2]